MITTTTVIHDEIESLLVELVITLYIFKEQFLQPETVHNNVLLSYSQFLHIFLKILKQRKLPCASNILNQFIITYLSTNRQGFS